MAFLNKGLKIILTDERHPETTARTAKTWTWTPVPTSRPRGTPPVVYKYDDGLFDYVTHLNSAKKVEVIHPEVIEFETEDTERQALGRDRDAVDHRLLRERPHLREHHQHA